MHSFAFIQNMMAFMIGSFLLISHLSNCSVGILHSVNEHTKAKPGTLKIFREIAKFTRLHSANKRLVLIFIYIRNPAFFNKLNKNASIPRDLITIILLNLFSEWLLIIQMQFNRSHWRACHVQQ